MKSSLHAAFVGIWLFVVAVCVALAILMQGLYRLGVDARVDTVAARVDKAASALQTRFALYAASYASAPDFTDAQRRRELGLILQIVLQEFDDVEGGFFAPQAGFIAYAYPSYEGSATKQDVPEAESARIAGLAQAVVDGGAPQSLRSVGARQTLILEAKPVGAGAAKLAVWVMSRAHVRADDGSNRLLVGLGVLGFFVVASGLAMLWILQRWTRALARLDDGIAHAPADRPLELEPTGHRDLDRVAAMVTSLHARLAEQRDASRRLASELARAQRVATVGRMAAQLVHEIRNPIAAMRLRAENALAGAGDRDAALDHILGDVHRLDDLLERMQAMTRLNALNVQPVPLAAWLARCVASLQERADERVVTLAADAPDATWPIDAEQMARALGNLVINAIRHAPQGDGRVDTRITIEPERRCRIHVGDNGPGIDDAALDDIFDAFHTTHAEGTGLGLSIAREIVEAHGGTLRALPRGETGDLLAASTGAVFLIELPWPAS